jgi:DNA polymerase-3 subunit alpha
VITSKLQDVVIETGFGVDDSIDEKIAELEYVKVI